MYDTQNPLFFPTSSTLVYVPLMISHISVYLVTTHTCMCVYGCISSQKQPTKPSTIGLQDKHVFLSVYLATTHMCLCVWGGGVCMGVYLLRTSQPSHEPK